jgi:cell wall integrity and stress response component
VKAFLPSSPPATSGQSSAAATQTAVISTTTSPIPRTTVLTSSTTGQTGFASTSIFTSASPTATAQPSASSSALSGGAIAGIVVGIFFFFLLSSLMLIIRIRMRRRMGKLRKFVVPQTYDPENAVKAPSYAFSPEPSSDVFPPHRQPTELSGSSDASTTEFRAQYVRSPIGPESSRQLPRAFTVVM